jgi:hypothetical protein
VIVVPATLVVYGTSPPQATKMGSLPDAIGS